jgi:hypothetical protein
MRTFLQKYNNPLVLYSIGGILVSLLSVSVWLFVQEPDTKFFFGEIVTVTDSTIVLDGRDQNHTVTIASTTKIIRENTPLTATDLATGQFVQVVVSNAPDSTIAESIRLLKKPPKRPHHEE